MGRALTAPWAVRDDPLQPQPARNPPRRTRPPATVDAKAPLPPTLVLQGRKDRVALVQTARQLQLFLAGRGSPHEASIYPNEGDAFSPASQADAGRRIAAFLKRHLG